MRKDIFIDGHKQSDIIEDCKNFLTKIEELKPYMVEFEEDNTIKSKAYPSDCAIGGNERWPIIVITYDKYTFSVNDGIWRSWTEKRDAFLQPKDRGQGIMTSKFLLPYGRLILAFLISEKRKEVI